MVEYAVAVDGDDGRSGLRLEIANHVLDVVPRVEPEKLFLLHEHIETTTIDEVTGAAPRLFAVTGFEGGEAIDMGSAIHDEDVDAMIEIWYPRGEVWKVAAKSDYWKIRQALLNDQTYEAGTQARIARDLSDDDFEKTDDGFWMRIPLLCRLRFTAS